MDENAKIKEIVVICGNPTCKEPFNPPVFFGDVKSYESTVTQGNKVQCPKCGQLTSCNKQNMSYILK